MNRSVIQTSSKSDSARKSRGTSPILPVPHAVNNIGIDAVLQGYTDNGYARYSSHSPGGNFAGVSARCTTLDRGPSHEQETPDSHSQPRIGVDSACVDIVRGAPGPKRDWPDPHAWQVGKATRAAGNLLRALQRPSIARCRATSRWSCSMATAVSTSRTMAACSTARCSFSTVARRSGSSRLLTRIKRIRAALTR